MKILNWLDLNHHNHRQVCFLVKISLSTIRLKECDSECFQNIKGYFVCACIFTFSLLAATTGVWPVNWLFRLLPPTLPRKKVAYMYVIYLSFGGGDDYFYPCKDRISAFLCLIKFNTVCYKSVLILRISLSSFYMNFNIL
jgi:hypothetical protein